MKKRLVIGITGGIATGKSTVMALLAEYGIPGISSDSLAHECIRKGKPAYKRILRFFGRSILDQDLQIDRRRLGAIVFQNPKARKQLEGFIHPCVIQGLKRFMQSHSGTIALDIPLLYEAHLEKMVDHILVVTASQAQQIERITRRNGLTRAQALARIHSQWPLRLKAKQADSVIANTQTRRHLTTEIRKWKEKTLDS